MISTTLQMNQIRSPVIVQLDLNRVKKVIKGRKKNSAVLDNIENIINKLDVNSSGVFSSPYETKIKRSNTIKDELKLEFMEGFKHLNVIDNHGKKKSKTVSSTHILSIDKDMAKKMNGTPFPEFKICVKTEKGGRKLHCETQVLNNNVDTIKDVQNMIALPEINIITEDDTSNEGKKCPCKLRFIGFIDLKPMSDDNDIKIKPFISTTNKSSPKIVQQTSVSEKYELKLESIKLNNADTTCMDEPDVSNKSVKTNFSENELNDVSSNYIIDTIDLTLDSNSDSELSSDSCSTIKEQIDYTKTEKYEMLKMIVFNRNNYEIYHNKIMIKLAKKLKKKKLLWKLKDSWNVSEAKTVIIILEDILKLIFHMENKNIVFMGCLSIIFRKTVVSFYNVTDAYLYEHFKLFTDVIEKCLMNINDLFWKTLFPSWNIFCNGCLIVDLIIHGQKMSMGKFVNWNEIPSTQKYSENSNIQLPFNKLHSFNNKLEKPHHRVSLMPSSISDIITELSIPNISSTVTASDGEPRLRKRSVDISSMSSTSNKLTEKLPLANDEGLAKKKKLEDTSPLPCS